MLSPDSRTPTGGYEVINTEEKDIPAPDQWHVRVLVVIRRVVVGIVLTDSALHLGAAGGVAGAAAAP
jgi:hypothetical protein